MPSPTVRNVAIGFAILCGSYLAAGLINAPTISQPRLTSAYSRSPVVIVVEPKAPESDDTSEAVKTDVARPARNLAL